MLCAQEKGSETVAVVRPFSVKIKSLNLARIFQSTESL